ncbi:MAG TPA: isoprenylcysteine carboxylmethyltransferase family protein [Anaerolineales bacterium]|nr:isoprenylcysteine carboxylmethyltransferase family protein [Anaerolineales bacterium]
MKPEIPQRTGRRELVLPRWAVPLVWAVIVLGIQVLLPWVVARIGPRFGWDQLTPAWWNLTGLIAVAIGLGLYAWCLVFHFRSYRASVRVGFSPPQLVIAGPYQISRNPMYVSGLFTWLGWVVFYGSPAVFIALVLLWTAFAFRVIPYEERQLEALFGDAYLAYKRSVRRWLGRF